MYIHRSITRGVVTLRHTILCVGNYPGTKYHLSIYIYIYITKYYLGTKYHLYIYAYIYIDMDTFTCIAVERAVCIRISE